MAVVIVGTVQPYMMKLGIDKYIAEEKPVSDRRCHDNRQYRAVVCSRLRMLIMGKSNSILLTTRQSFIHYRSCRLALRQQAYGQDPGKDHRDVNSLNDVFANSVTSLVPELVKISAVVVIMMLMNYRLGLVALATLPFMLVTFFFISTVSRKRWQTHRKKSSNLNAFTHEDFSGIRVVQSFAAEQETSSTFLQLCNEWRDSFVRAVRINDFFWPTVEMSWGIGSILVFWFGASMIGTGTITPGLLVAFTSYVSMFWQPIMNIAIFTTSWSPTCPAPRGYSRYWTSTRHKDRQDAKPLPEIKGDVSFRNVTFGYDEGQQVLKDVSFDVSAGQTIALVGSTGAGKTTVANLISRFYEVTSGEVLIDGYNVNDVTLESLRSQIGLMPQDTFLFSTTIMENIRYGKLDATDEEVIEAAKAVSAHEFIMKFEIGSET